MAFVHEASANAPRAAIQVFVAAPRREIDIPLVQLQWQIPRGVRHVKSDHASFGVARLGDAIAIKRLPAVIIHAREKNQGDPLAFRFDQRLYIFCADVCFAGAWTDFDQRIGRIVTVKTNLRRDGIAVRRKRVSFD